eukprot:8723312-Pyramimonas_sp.AAC.1
MSAGFLPPLASGRLDRPSPGNRGRAWRGGRRGRRRRARSPRTTAPRSGARRRAWLPTPRTRPSGRSPPALRAPPGSPADRPPSRPAA